MRLWRVGIRVKGEVRCLISFQAMALCALIAPVGINVPATIIPTISDI
jgi:hypothetical protein